jgi:hypothetical protein
LVEARVNVALRARLATAPTAIGTLLAVVVALGLQFWLSWQANKKRPEIALAFDHHARADEIDVNTGASVPFLRLAVSNAPGKDTAHRVEVIVLGIKATGGSGVMTWLANPALAWANSLNPEPVVELPSGVTRYVDVGQWVQLTPLTLVLSLQPQPGSQRHYLTPGSYEIELAVTADNGEASTWIASVSFLENVQSGLSSPVNVQASVRAA